MPIYRISDQKCACGCGQFTRYNDDPSRPHRYVFGHTPVGPQSNLVRWQRENYLDVEPYRTRVREFCRDNGVSIAAFAKHCNLSNASLKSVLYNGGQWIERGTAAKLEKGLETFDLRDRTKVPIEDVRKIIQLAREKRGLSNHEIAEICGISPASLKGILYRRNRRWMPMATARHIGLRLAGKATPSTRHEREVKFKRAEKLGL